ncbi:MAG: DUF1622 domain-containing protein [Actinomycetales bacterium]
MKRTTGVYRTYRRSLGRAILLGLELLVAGDIIRKGGDIARTSRCMRRAFSVPSPDSSASISARAPATASTSRVGASEPFANAAAARPVIRPYTMSSIRELPPSRLAPCSPLAASPMT